MNIGQLYAYLGELIDNGTSKNLPVVVPGIDGATNPNEVSEVVLIDGVYDADPAPLAPGQLLRSEQCLLLYGTHFDIDTIQSTHDPQWPYIETPTSTEKKYAWPDGEVMDVACPNCAANVSTQIGVVRDDDLPLRPEDCEACRATFIVYPDGRTELVSAPRCR